MKLLICLVLAAVAATTTHGGIHHYRHDRHYDSSGDAFRRAGEGIDNIFAGTGGGRPESLLNPWTIEGSDPQNHLRHDHD